MSDDNVLCYLNWQAERSSNRRNFQSGTSERDFNTGWYLRARTALELQELHNLSTDIPAAKSILRAPLRQQDSLSMILQFR
jgi:hypothetical protein